MIELKNIDTDNFNQVIKLKVSKEQENFVASNNTPLLKADGRILSDEIVYCLSY